MERVSHTQEDHDDFMDGLFSPLDRRNAARGDNVAPEVVAEEMSLFNSFAVQHAQLSQGG